MIRHSRFYVIATATTLFLIVMPLIISRFSIAHIPRLLERENSGIQYTNITSASTIYLPKVVLPEYFNSDNEKFRCKMTKVMKMTFPVCLYTAETDVPITEWMLRGIYFEKSYVIHFIRLLRRHPRLQFVDIGANIGIYSLPIARVTQVVAVEPNWRSMSRLAKAVRLGEVNSKITLVHNAVSNVRATLNIGVHPTNQGVSFLINATDCNKTAVLFPCNTLSSTKTILLNDLLPLMQSNAAVLKVDVEGHEVNVFTNPSAGQFFDHINIPVVFMEWILCKKHPKNTVLRLIDFFYSRNYTVFNLKNIKLHRHYKRWPGNVMFKKFPHIVF